MTFARPDWVALAPLAALLLALMLGQQWRRLHALWDVYDDPVVRRLVPARVDRFPTVRLACLVLAALAIGFAAAGPEPSGTPASRWRPWTSPWRSTCPSR